MEDRISCPNQAVGHNDEDTPATLKWSDCCTSPFYLRPPVVARGRLWGETRYSSGSTPTSLRYTGQREDASIGLYFYNARYEACPERSEGTPALGRFIQPDTGNLRLHSVAAGRLGQ